MKVRGLVAAVVVLAALTGALYWSNHHKPGETAQPAADLPPHILVLKPDEIIGIAIKKKDANEVVLKKSGNDWSIVSPQPYAADQSAVSSMVSALSALDAQRLVDDRATDLSPYGLAEPSVAIDVTETNHRTQKLLLGDQTPTGDAAYAKLEGDPRVFTLASFNKTSLDKSLSDLRDKRLVTVDADKITRIDLDTRQQDIEFGRDKDQWQIVRPKPMRADASQVDSLVRAIADARIDLSPANDPRKNASAFASASQVASLKITTPSGEQDVQVRKVKDDYYAKSSGVDGIYKVTGSLGQQLDKKLEDYRNKKLFDFGFAEPDKIEIHDGAKYYSFTHSGNDWWSADGKKLDGESVEPLVSKLRDLQASKFADSGFTNTVLELTVTSSDGKRAEKVRISKATSGQDFVAERQNEAALYVLDQSTVEDLRSLAAGAKPASNSKK